MISLLIAGDSEGCCGWRSPFQGIQGAMTGWDSWEEEERERGVDVSDWFDLFGWVWAEKIVDNTCERDILA